jgi:F0F1-type ATP synthase assembly protein I
METQVTGHSKPQSSHDFSKRLLRLAGSGGAAFWFTDFLLSVSPIAAEYKAAFSISNLPVALAEALVGGLMIGFIVSFFLLHFYDKIPSKNPVVKALILSLAAMVIIEVLSTLVDPINASIYLLIDTGMNLPRFIALGIVIGYVNDKFRKGSLNESNCLH